MIRRVARYMAMASVGVSLLGTTLACWGPTKNAQGKIEPVLEEVVQQEVQQVEENKSPEAIKLKKAVLEYFLTDKKFTKANGKQEKLYLWDQTIDDMGRGKFKAHIDNVVDNIIAQCDTYDNLPQGFDCPRLVVSVFIQESRLFPYATSWYAAGIAQISAETAYHEYGAGQDIAPEERAFDLSLMQGTRYDQWTRAVNGKKAVEEQRRKMADKGKKPTAKDNRWYNTVRGTERKFYKEFRKNVKRTADSLVKSRRGKELEEMDDRYVPERAIPVGVDYVVRMRRKFGKDRYAVNAYNAGPTRVGDVIKRKRSLPRETRQHEAGTMHAYNAIGKLMQAAE